MYFPVARRHRPLAGTPCVYPWRDGQAELTSVADINVSHQQLNPDTVTHPSTERARCRFFVDRDQFATAAPDHHPSVGNILYTTNTIQLSSLLWLRRTVQPYKQLHNSLSRRTATTTMFSTGEKAAKCKRS